MSGATPEPLDGTTPTEALILEVLAARYRLGERVWPFERRYRRQLDRLQAAGFITYQSGVHSEYDARLTPQGIDALLSPTYRPPSYRAVGRYVAPAAAGTAMLGLVDPLGFTEKPPAEGQTLFVREGDQ